MTLKVNKPALAAATAGLMTMSAMSAFSLAGSAAQNSEITLSADKLTASAGDMVNVKVGFEPGDTGAAGFTIDLHYDPDKVDVYIPNSTELSSKYDVGSKFSVIANYSSAPGEVRIVGANLSSDNITSDTDLALASFKVKDGAKGDLDFWVEVDTIVSASDDGFVNAAYSAPTESSPFTVSVPEKTVTKATTTTTAAATTSATTTKAETVSTTAKPTTTKAETVSTTTKPTTTKAETVSTTTKSTTTKAETESTTSKATTTTKAETESTTAKTTTTTKAVTTTQPQTSEETEKPQVTTVPQSTPESNTAEQQTTHAEKVPEDEQLPTSPEVNDSDVDSSSDEQTSLFSYTQGDTDFNSEEDLSYSFSLDDYITDYSRNYNISVDISTTGNVNGGIGMNVGGEWVSFRSTSHYVDKDVWTAENIDPNKTGNDVFVQLYYLKANATFSIDAITVEPTETVSAPTDQDDEQTPLPEEQPQVSETTDNTNDTDNTSDEQSAENDNANGADADNSDDTAAPSTGEEQTADPEVIEEAVDSAAAEADSQPDHNPTTGSKASPIKFLLMLACLGEIAWSLFVTVFNRLKGRSE